MANVHCQSCGRTYDYEKYGCCPNCGAYHLPHRACKACGQYNGRVVLKVEESN